MLFPIEGRRLNETQQTERQANQLGEIYLTLYEKGQPIFFRAMIYLKSAATCAFSFSSLIGGSFSMRAEVRVARVLQLFQVQIVGRILSSFWCSWCQRHFVALKCHLHTTLI